MAMQQAANFWAALPSRLTPEEANLRECLLRTASAAQAVLKNSKVPLQEWVERRMPAELQFRVAANGKMTIETAQASAHTRGKGATLQGKSEGKGAANSSSGKGSKEEIEAWIKSLPPDSFSTKEEQLREVIITRLTQGPTQVTKISADPAINSICRTFLPHHVPLATWIKKRIGGEVSVENGMCKLLDENGEESAGVGSQGEEDAQAEDLPVDEDVWFNRLPADAFTQEEEQMRDSILEFLAAWQKKEKAVLTQVEADEAVRSASSKLLPQGVPLQSWIDRRIGGEIKLQPTNGRLIIEVVSDDAREAIKEKARKRLAEAASRQRAASQQAVLDPEAFFNKLPDDKLSQPELNLRQALLRFLDVWFKRNSNGPPPKQSDLLGNAEIQRCKAVLLPKNVLIKDWVERRIGGEIRTSQQEDGQVEFFCDGQWAPPKAKASAAPRASESSAAGKGVTPETAAPQVERKASQRPHQEAFFKSLPSDSFREEEEKLREALLDFLGSFKGAGPPRLSAAGMDKNIKTLSLSLLPKGSGLPMLKEWIDKRIGGEVETRDTPEGVVFAVRGELDELLERARRRVSAAPATSGGAPGAQKRKADVLGSGAGGCSKGKGKQAKKGGATSSFGR